MILGHFDILSRFGFMANFRFLAYFRPFERENLGMKTAGN
jgi:hypothetical protein